MGQIDLNRTALLVTGTIVPNSSFVAHTNVEQRRREYIDSLSFYRKQFPKSDLFFLENSSYPFEADKEFLEFFKKENIQLMKFPVSDKFAEGKGYQEFEMLDKAVSELGAKYNYFLKITGRYKVENVLQLIPASDQEMIADSHKKLHVTQTNVFFVRSSFYEKNIAGLYKLANDANGKFIEHVVYDTLTGKKIIDQVALFKKNPVITGFSGSYGGSLSRNKYKMKLRNFERGILRILGIHQFLVEY